MQDKTKSNESMETIPENGPEMVIRNRKVNGKNIKSKSVENNKSDDEKNKRFQSKMIGDEPKSQAKVKVKNEGKSSTSSSADAVLVNEDEKFFVHIRFDIMSVVLFTIAAITRFYRLGEPRSIVFDEIHFGKYMSMYMKNVFFFDQHPPLGKQLIAGVGYLAGFNGIYTFPRIGAKYTDAVPVFWLRFVPALCGSLLAPTIYNILRQIKLNRWACALGGFLIIFDNALLTQSRFILMESMLLLFSALGLLYLLKFLNSKSFGGQWWMFGALSATFLTCALCIKYVGFYANILAFMTTIRHLWKILPDKTISTLRIFFLSFTKMCLFIAITVALYIATFYIHLTVLTKAGPHDSVMTSAFQASLEGGLASITKGQPIYIQHGSQITLRHTHGRVCWLHSHNAVYPVRYEDGRGSSHQQQVTCYSFKDVNNWWIVKRPEKEYFNFDEHDLIKDGDVIQLVHGITSRGLNSHDVAAPVTPQTQEVSCYIDYNVSMSSNLLWRVDIINKNAKKTEQYWHTISSQIRLVHVDTGAALKFTGRQLPDWGFNQHEISADRVVEQEDTIWNVEEHRTAEISEGKEREKQLLNAEMIPTAPTSLTFWEKFMELQFKMVTSQDAIQAHMYSTLPIEWPLMDKGIAYWIDTKTNAQIHLIGNVVIWYSATISIFTYISFLAFYLMRRRRLCYDLTEAEWNKFLFGGEFFLTGYLIHYLPYFFLERTLFLYNYLPALMYKILLLVFVIEHIHFVIRKFTRLRIVTMIYNLLLVAWICSILYFFKKYSVFSYANKALTSQEISDLRLKDTWDFVQHRSALV